MFFYDERTTKLHNVINNEALLLVCSVVGRSSVLLFRRDAGDDDDEERGDKGCYFFSAIESTDSLISLDKSTTKDDRSNSKRTR